ncbi:histidinol-phosphate transaminase [uncultured Zhongshania sp.]|jgi:histidinol-phosphate aminotransferase|uniref:histidinol-phosphate transaminase n=1 Tax=uncultured Zhongshania sp. TaxID=1642288 RepID=UPI0030DA48DC|tara:strand:- start:2780 stop:3844 length:1065 start_codon:yes stop_codon:yes gene_type:complete
MSRYWSPFVKDLVPYVPGEQPKLSKLTKLNTNENPYGPSPKVLEVIRAEATAALRLYPDPNSDVLKTAIADYHGVATEQVFVGNGSDEVLAHVFHGLFQHGKPLLFPDITYSFYPVYCGLYKIPYEVIPLDDKFQIKIEEYRGINGGIIFPNPNAPTGCFLSLAEIERLLTVNNETVVVIDEAYVDFGGDSAISLVDRFPNLLVTQTLSKSRSLAGLRVGFAVGHPDLIEALERIKNSFNSYPLDRLAQLGAAASFADESYFQQTRHAVMSEREAMVTRLASFDFQVLPSSANFVFCRHVSRDASELAAGLREDGVIVRHFKMPRIEQYLRITVGRPEDSEVLFKSLQRLLASA